MKIIKMLSLAMVIISVVVTCGCGSQSADISYEGEKVNDLLSEGSIWYSETFITNRNISTGLKSVNMVYDDEFATASYYFTNKATIDSINESFNHYYLFLAAKQTRSIYIGKPEELRNQLKVYKLYLDGQLIAHYIYNPDTTSFIQSYDSTAIFYSQRGVSDHLRNLIDSTLDEYDLSAKDYNLAIDKNTLFIQLDSSVIDGASLYGCSQTLMLVTKEQLTLDFDQVVWVDQNNNQVTYKNVEDL